MAHKRQAKRNGTINGPRLNIELCNSPYSDKNYLYNVADPYRALFGEGKIARNEQNG